MHRLFFDTKRVWLAVTRHYWKAWEKLGLTHARYDFLLVIESQGEVGITQAELGRVLGVSRAAVSKMGKLLEKLKLITREYVINRRTLSLRLTDKGKKAHARARTKFTRPQLTQGCLEAAFGERAHPYRAVGDAICDLEALAWGFGAPLAEGFLYPGPYPHPFSLTNERLARESTSMTPAPRPKGLGARDARRRPRGRPGPPPWAKASGQ